MSFKQILHHLNRRDTRIIPRFSKTAKFFLFLLIAVTSVFFVARSLAIDSILQENIDAWKVKGNFNTLIGPDSSGILISTWVDNLTNIKEAPPEVLNGLYYNGKRPVWIPGGLIGSTSNTISYLYNQPISGLQYLAQVKDEFLGKPAYAQGVGFQGLQPLLPVWRAFRNVVYILASLIFIIIGIMIMLRVKISPQAVINVQNAIPQLITALILVTFSYAIAGLIVDLMYLIQGLVLAIIFNGVGKGLTDNLLSPSIPNIGTSFAGLNSFNFGELFWLSIKNTNAVAISLIGGLITGVVVSLFAAPVTGVIAGGIGSLLFLLIICVLIFFLIVKFLFGLIKCYITLIIKIVLAPLEIGMGAFPNSKLNFSSWIMDVLANISVFPISLIFLVLVNFIAESATGLWTPNIISLVGAGNLMGTIIALGGLMLLPKLPEMIPQYVFMLKPSPWGTAIGEGLQAYDPRKSGLYKTGTQVGKNYIANEIVDKNKSRRLTRLGGILDRAAGRINPGDPESVRESLGEGIRKS